MAEGAWMEAQVFRLTPADIAKGAQAAVEWESLCRQLWAEADAAGTDDAARTVVRAALIRLLSSPHWMPGSVEVRAGRLEIRIAVEMDSHAEGIHRRALEHLAHEADRAREGLRTIVADLGKGDDDA